jgi:Concanavalin A-like lectin/glucanases superfamily
LIDRLTVTGRDKSECEILEEATLAAYFSFNAGRKLTDQGPNSLPSVIQALTSVPSGRSLQAISFSRLNGSYLQVGDLTGLGISNRPFTISLWIRPRSLVGVLVHVSNNPSGLGWCFPFIGFAANGSLVAKMFNSNPRSVIGPSVPISSTWTHVVQTWSPTSGLRLYMDNVLIAFTTSMATSYTASSQPNYITLGNSLNATFGGCQAGLLGSMTRFDGDIDEFRVYSRELSANDICTLFVV